MHIFCLELQLALPSLTLKEKRGIVKSILGRARNRFNVACAEVDRQDNPRCATIGFVTVSSDKVIARSSLERVEDWVYENWPDLEIVAVQITEL